MAGEKMKFWKIASSRELRIIFLVLIIVIIGLIGIISASQGTDTNYTELKKQLIAIFAGSIALAVAASIDYDLYVKYWYILYTGAIVLLILVLFTDPINNARSWFIYEKINFGIQPSEFSKIVIIITVAKFLTDLKSRSMTSKEAIKNVVFLILIIIFPIALIIKQPDFGTAMVFVASIVAMLFVWGIDIKIIKYGIISMAVTLPAGYFFLLKPGQKERIRVFLNPERDPTGSGYHVLQSKLAIGSGQLTGMGLFNGTQTQMGYLFAKTTDFIFSSIAEEMGFIVASILIILLILLVINFFEVAANAKDEEGKLIATGIGMMFGFHIIVNIGMTMGLVPVTGIPLPFVSAGGSSTLTNMIALGIILGISFRKKGLYF
jgi:rod shape determining protein RodA